MQEGTWACLRWRSPFFPGAGRRRPCSGAARWGMQTRTQNQRAQAWSQEAAAAQWPFGERKTTGQSALTVRWCCGSRALTGILAAHKHCRLCWQTLLVVQPSNTNLPKASHKFSSRTIQSPPQCAQHGTNHKYALLGWGQGALHKEENQSVSNEEWFPGFLALRQQSGTEPLPFSLLFLQMVFISGCLTYWPYTFIPLQKRVTCESFPLFTATSVIPVTAPWPFILLILDRSS